MCFICACANQNSLIYPLEFDLTVDGSDAPKHPQDIG